MSHTIANFKKYEVCLFSLEIYVLESYTASQFPILIYNGYQIGELVHKLV